MDEIEKLDKEHIFDEIGSQPSQLLANYVDSMRDDVTSAMGVGINHLVLAGMGGSALAGNIARNWLFDRLSVPFEVVRGYSLPGYVDNHSVVVISSYSGNTEETLATLEDAQKRNANIFILTNGGKLAEIAQQKNYPVLKLPNFTQPRLSVFAALKALGCLVEDLGLAYGVDLRRELEDVGNWLEEQKFALSPDNFGDNPARTLASKLMGHPVLIYGTPATGSAAYKWKIDINENAKQLAWYNTFPELNHNELQSWLFPDKKDLACVQLSSPSDSKRIKKRIAVTAEVLAEHGFSPHVVEAQGSTFLQNLLYLILFGDYMSAYMGIDEGVDPTPVDLVEEFKKKLD